MNNRNEFPRITREVVEMTGRTRASLEQWLVDFDGVNGSIQMLQMNGPLTPAAQNQLLSLNYERNRLQGDVQGAQFCQQPNELLNSLIKSIRRHMADYEMAFPAEQSACIQLCLYQAQTYLAFIERLPVENDDQQKRLYFALCGMMWSMLVSVDNSYDQAFAQSILRVLCEHRMDKRDALAEYDQFCHCFQAYLPSVTPLNVSHVLRQRFHDAKQQLVIEVSRDRYRHSFALLDLRCKAKAVMHEVDNYKVACELQNKPFDYNLYASVLSSTQQLMVNPQDDRLKSKYESLMSHNKQGDASPKHMLAGAMLAFVGALTIAGTFIAEAVTACASTAVTLPLKIAGFGAMFAGITLFSIGKPHGTKSAMHEFREEVNYCNRRQSLSSDEQQRLDEHLPLLTV